ncbi:MAG: YhjD/YihY/BrkB family envelope integrity protein [Gemmatimonadota bacterium]
MTRKTIPESERAPQDSRSLMALVRRFANDAADLVRQEIALARAEIGENIKDFFRNAGKLVVGGSVASVGLLVFVVFLVIGLGVLLGGVYWLSSLIVAAVLILGGGGLAFSGLRKLKRTSLAPDQSIGSLRHTKEWASEATTGFKRALGVDGRPRSSRPLRAGGTPAVSAEGRRGTLPPADRATLTTGPSARGADDRLPVSAPLYKRVLHEIGEDDVVGQGAKVAYFMFTSLPPALLVLFALAGFFGGAPLGDFLAAQLQGVLPGSADDPSSAAGFIHQFVDQVVTERAPGPLSIGLLLGIWAGSTIFVALGDSLNKAYDLDDSRSWFKRRAISIGVMFGFLVLFIAGSGILIVGPQVAGALQLGGAANLAWAILQWPLAFLLVVAAFFVVYFVLPNRDQGGCKSVLFKSSAIAAGLWLLATLAFRLYISNFGSYGETYGFVGAILVLLLWMYITAIVILVGGEISSEMERTA